MLNKDLMDCQLSSNDSQMLADIEDIRQFVLDKIKASKSHVEITRCFETITGYGTSSSNEENKKWIYAGKRKSIREEIYK